MSSDKEEILAAIAGLADRLSSIEKRVTAMDGRLMAVEGRLATIGETVTHTAEDVRDMRHSVIAAKELLPSSTLVKIGLDEAPPPNNVVRFAPVKEG